MTVLKTSYQNAKDQFAKGGIDTAALDARLLMCHALGLSHEEFILRLDHKISDEEMAIIDLFVTQRLQRKPVAKIIGQKEFYGRSFITNQHTLDPRPDSEVLVEAVMKHASGDLVDILDLGTGTGCLVLTLLAEMLDKPRAIATAIDRSTHALAVAMDNAENLNVADRVVFVKSHWFDNVSGQFDIIICNPPYIPQTDIEALQPEVRLFDPMDALVGGIDGLDPYRIIIGKAGGFLKSPGLIVFEVGQGQAQDVAKMLENQGFQAVEIIKDLAGIERVVLAKRA